MCYASPLLRNSPPIPIMQTASFSLTAPLHRTSLSAPSHHPPLLFSHDITIPPRHTMLADASGRRDAFCSQLPRSRLPDRVGKLFASNVRAAFAPYALLINSRCSYCAAKLGDRVFSWLNLGEILGPFSFFLFLFSFQGTINDNTVLFSRQQILGYLV